MGYADCKSLRINELYSISLTYVYLANTYLQLIYLQLTFLQLVKQKNNKKRFWHRAENRYLVDMKAIEFILSLFVRRRRFTLGAEVFQSKSWLQKQVEEAQYQQARKIVLGID